jgi:hypothetical protein
MKQEHSPRRTSMESMTRRAGHWLRHAAFGEDGHAKSGLGALVGVVYHAVVDYEIYDRLEALEGKK